MANEYMKRKKQSKEGSEVSEIGEVDHVFTSAKDAVAIFTSGVRWCGVKRRVFSGWACWADKVHVAVVSCGCEVYEGWRVACGDVDDPVIVPGDSCVNSRKPRFSTAFTKAHNPGLNHGLFIAVRDH